MSLYQSMSSEAYFILFFLSSFPHLLPRFSLNISFTHRFSFQLTLTSASIAFFVRSRRPHLVPLPLLLLSCPRLFLPKTLLTSSLPAVAALSVYAPFSGSRIVTPHGSRRLFSLDSAASASLLAARGEGSTEYSSRRFVKKI